MEFNFLPDIIAANAPKSNGCVSGPRLRQISALLTASAALGIPNASTSHSFSIVSAFKFLLHEMSLGFNLIDIIVLPYVESSKRIIVGE
jgi:hypothetical protein